MFDQAIYAKAAEIIWKHPDKFKDVILRMGAFHIMCNLISIIGKRFQDSGLKDIIIEAGIVAQGSVAGVLEGRQYNRAVRTHKCMYEAFLRMAFKEFPVWMEQHHLLHKGCIDEGVKVIQQLHEGLSPKTYNDVMSDTRLDRMLHYFELFLDFLRSNNGDLSAFWMSYIDMVTVLLGLLRASREGNWDLHVACIRYMLPWCFAYDKINYARYLSVYYAEMSRLYETHPDVYVGFKQGWFAVQIGESNTFGRIPVDQTTEETINKDTKTPGGTCYFSLNPGAVRRYYLTSEYRSAYIGMLREMVQVNKSDLQHKCRVVCKRKIKTNKWLP